MNKIGKILMSYFSADKIHSVRDAEGVIEVVDERQVRTLHFGSLARQSTMFLKNVNALALAYTRCMMTSLLFCPPPRTALVLGVGGGSLPKFLLHHFPQCQVDAVDKRQKVVEVARAYFALPDLPRLQVHVGDGVAYLDESTIQYDLMMVDLHDSEGMAPAVFQPTFFTACHQQLAANGIFVINLWCGRREGELKQIQQRLGEAFAGQVLYLPVANKSNCVALGFKGGLTLQPLPELRQKATALDAEFKIELADLLEQLARHNPHILKEE
jgi:spermidine synthase